MRISINLAQGVDPKIACQEIKTLVEQITGQPCYITIKQNPSVSLGALSHA